MLRVFFLILCLAGNLATLKAAIDLNPALTEYTAQGITFKQLVFKDDKRQISYELPSQWSYRKSGDSIKLVPPNNSTADIAIQTRRLNIPQPLDKKGIAAAHEHFLSAIPAGIQMLKVLSEQPDSIPFKGAANYEITASYQVLGQTYTRRAIYINLPDTQLIFRLSSPTKEFEVLYRTFRTSILSWQWLEHTASTVAASK